MGLIILRLLVIFYVLGIMFLLITLITKNMVEKKHTFLGLVFFPFLLFTKSGRNFLHSIIKGE